MSMVSLPTTIFSVVFVLIGLAGIIFSFLTAHSTVIENLVKPSFDHMDAVDAAHNTLSCISENSFVNENKLESCRQDLKLSYAEVLDTETGKKVFSGNIDQKKKSYRIFGNVKSGDEVHQVKVYVIL